MGNRPRSREEPGYLGQTTGSYCSFPCFPQSLLSTVCASNVEACCTLHREWEVRRTEEDPVTCAAPLSRVCRTGRHSGEKGAGMLCRSEQMVPAGR